MKYSTSSLNTSFRCMQLWDYTYNHKIEPIDSGSFEASYGRAFHGLLESDDEPLSFFGPKWQAVIRAHHTAYTSYWEARDKWQLKYHEHEIKFQYKLAEGYNLHGIVDGVAEMEGKNYLVESKTTGTSIDKFLSYKEHTLQASIYMLAAKHSPELQHYDIQGVIYDVTNRPSIRQRKKTESDQDYVTRCSTWFYDNREKAFNRVLLVKSDEYLDDVAGDVMMQIDTIGAKRWTKNRDSCYAFGRQCGFHSTCFGDSDLTNNELYQVRTRR